MRGNKVEIKQNLEDGHCNFSLKIDGVEVKFVKSIEFTTSVDEMPTILLEFHPYNIDVELNETWKVSK